jgi:lipopolysaccharide/colanic/teichoic acid biosynthesis glycosyltransferase
MKPFRIVNIFLGDLIAFSVAFLLFLLTAFPLEKFYQEFSRHIFPLSIIIFLWIIILFIFNFYEHDNLQPTLPLLKRFGIAGSVMFAVGISFFYLHPYTNLTPKTNLIIFLFYTLISIYIIRRLLYKKIISRSNESFSIICNNTAHHDLVETLEMKPYLGFNYYGTYKNIFDYYQQNKKFVDTIIIHKIDISEAPLLEKILSSNTRVLSLAEAYESILFKIPVHSITYEWILYSISKNKEKFFEIFIYGITIVCAVLIIFITLPVTLLVAFLIWYHDRGPIIIKQVRVGIHGKPFFLYKFRSMIALGSDGQAESGKAVWSSGSDDPRITPIGKIIRKLHIDEIPQMINLIKGDISFVGPRPERPEFVHQLEKEIPFYFIRHVIKPGFTGWAQIKYRYARTISDSREKFEYDLYYLKNRHLFLDLGIILKTVQIIFTH